MTTDKGGNDNVILLPRTIDYYQEELTRMLETERYPEAIQLLEFLLECRADDVQTVEEWHTLLDWLKNAFKSDSDRESDEDPEITEHDLRKQQFYTKMSEDPTYVKKLLEILLNDPAMEKKMAALEQLAIAEHPHIDDTLVRWLEQVELHPLVQYKVLQTLRARGATGRVTLHRAGELVDLEIADTPLDMIHFDAPIQAVAEKVRAECEDQYPSLVYFADHIWKEFLAYLYGTSVYRTLTGMNSTAVAEWAAALHSAVIEAMSGSIPEGDLAGLYGLSSDGETTYKQHREQIRMFMQNTFLP